MLETEKNVEGKSRFNAWLEMSEATSVTESFLGGMEKNKGKKAEQSY